MSIMLNNKKENNKFINNIINSNIELKAFNNRKENIRNYGIDLLRIFSMINIIVLHINLFSKELNYNFNSPRFQKIWLSETMAYWGVNGFGIISGIVGYKRYKFSNLIFIWIQTFFYSTTISLYNYVKYKTEIRKKKLYYSFFPIFIRYHWYVNAYFCMYPFLPFINYGINNINKNSLRNVVIILFCFYSFYDMIITFIFEKKNYNFLNSGYSSLWLMILYINGGYLGKYILFHYKKTKVINHIFWLLVYLCSSFFSYEIFFTLLKIKSKILPQIFISYISPTMLIQAFSLILIFQRLNIKNYILKKIIFFFTPLTFNITLIHLQLLSEKYYLTIKFIEYFKNLSPRFLIIKTYGLAIMIYLFCAFIDFFRFLLFKKFKIKELCLFLEKECPKLIDKVINMCC